MDKEFWLERWVRDEIAFHQDAFNPHLRRHWPRLNAAHDARVFVPLCGKSLDMRWLREQGYAVLGVELSAIAVEAFFGENRETPRRFEDARFKHAVADEIHLLCGDFFDLAQDDLKDVGAVYDRASLVALPPSLRARYVEHLLNLLPSKTPILLLSFDYPQAEMQGPPFAVSAEEVKALYAPRAKVDLIEQLDALENFPRFRERGLSRLYENIYCITTD
jgi:thiopurine S-methyltransferase